MPDVRLWGSTLLGLCGCAGDGLKWANQRPQDPAPSGPRYLRVYKESHFQGLGQDFRGGLSLGEFGDRVARARVLFLGDHHTDRVLHDRMLDVLVELDRRALPYQLGLECIGTADEPDVRAFLAGRISLDDLRRTVRERWPESWLSGSEVDSRFYCDLLRHARTAGCDVFALEPAPRLPLHVRDQAIARTIRQRAAARPDLLLVVVVGETHLLGQGQLVRRVDLPQVTVAARLSVGLRDRAAAAAFLPRHRFAETDADVLFFLPLSPGPAPAPERDPGG